LNDALPLDIHGGSLRLRVSKTQGKSERLIHLQSQEAELGIDTVAYYKDFGERVSKVRSDLIALLAGYRAEGKKIAAYGAAAKGATLLNYAQLPKGTIDFVVDRNAHKIGKYMPGIRLPICDVDMLEKQQPDYVLILSWNFADEIVKQQHGYVDAGGTFLSAIPSPHIIEKHVGAE
jgi:hypothetical protein